MSIRSFACQQQTPLWCFANENIQLYNFKNFNAPGLNTVKYLSNLAKLRYGGKHTVKHFKG